MSLATQRDNLVLHYPLSGYPNVNLHTMQSQLPVEYQEVEYIEFNHTTDINLQFKYNLQTMGLSVIYQSTNTTQNGMIVASNSAPYFWLYYYGSSKVCIYAQNSNNQQRGQQNICPQDTQIHHLKIKNKIFYGDNVQKGQLSSETFTECGSNLFIGGGYSDPTYIFYGKIFSLHIFNNSDDKDIHNFIPCFRKSDNIIGVYDIITNTFCCNANNNGLNCGPVIKSLPNTYIPLDYIDMPAPAAGANSEHNTVSISSLSYNKIIAEVSKEGAGSSGFILFSNSSSYYLNGNKNNNNLSVSAGGTVTPTNIKENTWTTLTLSFTSTQNALKLASWTDSTNHWTAQHSRYKYVLTFNNNCPTAYLIPALRISDKKPGMYDLVTDTFYINQGTGEFTYKLLNIEYNCGNQSNNNLQGSVGVTDIVTWLSTDTPRYKYSYLFTDGKGITSGTFTNNFNNTFSISWWMKTSTANSSMPWGSVNGNRLNFYFSGGKLYHNTSDGAQNPYQNSGTNLTNTITNDGQWHHYVVTGNGTLNNLYKDGELIGKSKTYKGFTATQVHINGWAENAYPFPGSISDFRLYKAVLTEAEIKELYDMGKTS